MGEEIKRPYLRIAVNERAARHLSTSPQLSVQNLHSQDRMMFVRGSLFDAMFGCGALTR